jgi:hypothetical protein
MHALLTVGQLLIYVFLWIAAKGAPISAQLRRLVAHLAFPLTNANCLTERSLGLLVDIFVSGPVLNS